MGAPRRCWPRCSWDRSGAPDTARLERHEREDLARTAGCPAAALAALAHDPDPHASGDTAANAGCPRPVLIAAATSTEWYLRTAADEDPACPEALRLGGIAADPDPEIRLSAARGSTCGATLALLASDDDTTVRR